MLKPKSENFKVKVMLYKLDAVSNKVISRCHASIKIDGEELFFPATPELKKNVALFNSQVETDSFSIYLDEITGLYENKQAVLNLQIESQGTKMKMGQVVINLGGILNQKKYKIVNTFALAKCYDKTAKARVSVDFIPTRQDGINRQQVVTFGERREIKQATLKQALSNNPSERIGVNSGNLQASNWKQPNYKSRLAEESNYILQEKIYEYQQKMDNYRLSQTQLQEKLHQQISHKDDQINELGIELNRKSQQLAACNLQNEQLRFRVKQLNDEALKLKEQAKGLTTMLQTTQGDQESLRKENAALKASLENQMKTKENKEKYYNQELTKYTSRYLESEQERNKIIFQLEAKFKEEMERKENSYRSVLASNESKFNENVVALKQRIRKLEEQVQLRQQKLETSSNQLKKWISNAQNNAKELSKLLQQFEELKLQNSQFKKDKSQLMNELQILNFSYTQMDRQIQKINEQQNANKKLNQQLKMQLQMANQTIEEQRKQIAKLSKQLQVNREREYYLTQKYNEQLEIKSIHQENIRGESYYFRNEINKLRNQLTLAEQRLEQQISRNSQYKDKVHRLELETGTRGQNAIRVSEEKMNLQNQVRLLREELSQMEEAVMVLKEENLQLVDDLRDRRVNMENDKSVEWSIKIEQLQNDISEMVQKFKTEKQIIREAHKKQEFKKKEEMGQLQQLARRLKEQNQEIRRNFQRKEQLIKELQRVNLDTKNQIGIKERQIQQAKEQFRVIGMQLEQTQNKHKTAQKNSQQRLKEQELLSQKETATIKRLQQAKSSYQRIVNQLLEYLTKPFQSFVGYQEIINAEAEVDFVNLINLSVRKHCEERAKIRELIKKMQQNNRSEGLDVKKTEIEPVRYFQKHNIVQENYSKYTNVNNRNDEYAWKYQQRYSKDLETDELRSENSRLKREISELKVKLRSTQEEVGKAQRNADAQRITCNQLKRELQEIQDEIDKVNFQLKRKDRMVAQLESQLKDMHAELIVLKNNQTNINNGNYKHISRPQSRLREKEQAILSNRKDIIIKDLQVKMDGKMKEIQELNGQFSKLKHQNFSLKETVTHLSNQNKLIQTKYKDKSAKFAILQSQFQQAKAKFEENYQIQSLRHKKDLQALVEEVLKAQEDYIMQQRNNQLLTREYQELQKRLKNYRQESRQNENKFKKQAEVLVMTYKQKVNELQTSLITLKSQIQQLTFVRQELTLKIANLNSFLAKKSAQIQSLLLSIKSKEQKLFQLEQRIMNGKIESDSKIGELRYIIEQLQEERLKKEYELEELKFTSEGRILDIQKRLEQACKQQ